MDQETRKRLESAGWKIGDAGEFLGATAEQAAIVELRLNLPRAVRDRRIRRSLRQEQPPRLYPSYQDRRRHLRGSVHAAQRKASDRLRTAGEEAGTR
jgi:hypothetical protein